MIFRVSIVMAQVILQVIVVGDKYNNLICRAIIVIDLSSYYNQPQNKQTRGNVYQGYRLLLFGVLRRFQHCTGHITTGSWKGRGNQYI